ncbi:MAG TPA: hypothetical protein VGJ84_16495 [Polyangiaceae bacterium]
MQVSASLDSTVLQTVYSGVTMGLANARGNLLTWSEYAGGKWILQTWARTRGVQTLDSGPDARFAALSAERIVWLARTHEADGGTSTRIRWTPFSIDLGQAQIHEGPELPAVIGQLYTAGDWVAATQCPYENQVCQVLLIRLTDNAVFLIPPEAGHTILPLGMSSSTLLVGESRPPPGGTGMPEHEALLRYDIPSYVATKAPL